MLVSQTLQRAHIKEVYPPPLNLICSRLRAAWRKRYNSLSLEHFFLVWLELTVDINYKSIWCRSTFGPRGPSLSNPTSFLRPALPMAPTTDDNARDKQSILRLNPAIFVRDFTLYTTKDAIVWKTCLNNTASLTLYCMSDQLITCDLS